MHAPNRSLYFFVCQGRLKPGRMLLVDTKEKLFLDDKSLKEKIAGARPVTQWLRENVITMDDLYKHHDRERKISTGNIVEHVALYEGSEMEQDRCALQQ